MEEIIIKKLIEVVKKSSEIILQADCMDNAVSEKEGHANFVTKYDKAVQETLRVQFKEILPQAKFMGEEDEESVDISSGYAFVVDPIDGTTNFMKGCQRSAISVGILKDGERLVGIVYNPYQKELFYAKRGEGAFLNGKQIYVSKEPLKNGLVLFGTAPYYEELREKTFRLVYNFFTKSLDVRRSGSAALDLCDVACGRAELFFELRLSPWDYAAGSLIVEEAGGYVCGAEGNSVQMQIPQPVIACGAGVSVEDICREILL